MRSRLATGTLLVVLLAVAPTPALAQNAGGNPTQKQIATAVYSAERSKRLWATINICDTRKHPQTIGIRGQVPALGFPASISISIGVEFWSQAAKRFMPDPMAKRVITLSRVIRGIHQRGVTFRFAPRTGRLRGTAKFSWTMHGKLVGSTERLTTAPHRDADFADPAGFSAATCTIS